MTDRYDVVVVGGGPAGLAAALVLGRARLRTAVIDARAPRNRVTHASHGFLTRDGAGPMELLAIGREQLEPYEAVTMIHDRVTEVERLDPGYRVSSTDGRWETDRLILATGFRDELSRLEIPGIEEVYGRSVFPCPFCDGFENADKALAVFSADHLDHFVPMIRVWSTDLVLFTNGRAVDPELRSAFEARDIPVHEERIARLDHVGGQLRAVELQDGTRVEREAGFVGGDFTSPSTDFAAALGLERADHPWGMDVPQTGDAGATSIDGLYVVGDAVSGFGGVAAASYQGSLCAQMIVHAVSRERWG